MAWPNGSGKRKWEIDKEKDSRNKCNRLSDQTTTHPAKVEQKREDPKKKTSAKKQVS
jgi:hypothetical protein